MREARLMVRVVTGLCSQTDSHTSCDRLHLHHVNLTTVCTDRSWKSGLFCVQMLRHNINALGFLINIIHGKYFYLPFYLG